MPADPDELKLEDLDHPDPSTFGDDDGEEDARDAGGGDGA